jgi:hypothetical protein
MSVTLIPGLERRLKAEVAVRDVASGGTGGVLRRF